MNNMQEVFKTWQDATLDTWSFATKQVTNNETWFNAVNAQMDVALAGQKKMKQTVAASLEALDLPKKDDLVRLSVQVLSAETRAAECEDRLDRAESVLKAYERRIVELEQTVAALQQSTEKAAETPAEKPAVKPAEKPAVKDTHAKNVAAKAQAKVIKSRRK